MPAAAPLNPSGAQEITVNMDLSDGIHEISNNDSFNPERVRDSCRAIGFSKLEGDNQVADLNKMMATVFSARVNTCDVVKVWSLCLVLNSQY